MSDALLSYIVYILVYVKQWAKITVLFTSSLNLEHKVPVWINSLNKILPDLCCAVGIKKKTAHCLRFTCASRLFQSGVDEKLIREHTSHLSNALFKWEARWPHG